MATSVRQKRSAAVMCHGARSCRGLQELQQDGLREEPPQQRLPGSQPGAQSWSWAVGDPLLPPLHSPCTQHGPLGLLETLLASHSSNPSCCLPGTEKSKVLASPWRMKSKVSEPLGAAILERNRHFSEAVKTTAEVKWHVSDTVAPAQASSLAWGSKTRHGRHWCLLVVFMWLSSPTALHAA